MVLNFLRALQRHSLLHYVLSFAICAYLASTNSFGMKSLSESQSASLLNSVLSPLYPAQRRDDIVVVLVTDADVDEFDDRFPVSYFLHRMALTTIADFKPKAVFVDFVFAREQVQSDRSNTAEFTEFLAGYPAPLFMASSDPTDKRPAGVHPKFELGTLVGVQKFVNITSANMYCFERALARNIATGAAATCATTRADGEFKPSLALGVYKFMCAGASPDPRCPASAIAQPLRDSHFRVMWGSTPSRAFDFLPDRMSCATTSFIAKWHADEALSANCPYHPQITLTELMEASNDPALRQQLADRFRGKVIMYGGYFGPNFDQVRPPTVRAIPGVHLHAMALDNLLTFGNHFKADVASIGGGYITGGGANFVFLLLAFALKVTAASRAADRDTAGSMKFAGLAFTAVQWLLYIAFCAVAFMIFDLSPTNWIGAMIATLILPSVIAKAFGRVSEHAGAISEHIKARRERPAQDKHINADADIKA